jgi:hypothetical protein
MATTLKAAVESYLRAKAVSHGTRNEYFSTLRKWEQWGGGPPIEALEHKQIREFLDWVHEKPLDGEKRSWDTRKGQRMRARMGPIVSAT